MNILLTEFAESVIHHTMNPRHKLPYGFIIIDDVITKEKQKIVRTRSELVERVTQDYVAIEIRKNVKDVEFINSIMQMPEIRTTSNNDWHKKEIIKRAKAGKYFMNKGRI